MRYALIIVFIGIILILGYGLYINPIDNQKGEFCIGISVAGLFFLWMPLFIYHRWRNKDIKDYMLTKENIQKMKVETEEKKL
ncbi:MAG: hypothetical protein K0U54_08505 [Bacteroidetes bacterium]|nr:hypothetical protein [Bacteroidota bacterium]